MFFVFVDDQVAAQIQSMLNRLNAYK